MSTSSTSSEATSVTVHLKVLRQDAQDKPETRRWEQFAVTADRDTTVLDALGQVQRKPLTATGQTVAPVAWDGSCLEEICGACTMLINGKARMACSTRLVDVQPKRGPIVLEPLSKFPVVRDLVTSRDDLFDSLKKVSAWVRVDASDDVATVPALSQRTEKQLASLAACTACGACLDACPQYGPQSDYVGAAALNQVRLFNLRPGSDQDAECRTESVMGAGGVGDCGKAQNCTEVCPQQIPLVDSIQEVARSATRQLVLGWLLRSRSS